jgi:hypothetical protein
MFTFLPQLRHIKDYASTCSTKAASLCFAKWHKFSMLNISIKKNVMLAAGRHGERFVGTYTYVIIQPVLQMCLVQNSVSGI